MKMKKRFRIMCIAAAILLTTYVVCCIGFCAYAKPIVTRYGYPPHRWSEYAVGTLRLRHLHHELKKDHPVVFSGLRVFRPALMLSAELGLIPFDKRQA